MGCGRCMSSTMSLRAVRWPEVNRNGRMARADSRMRSSTVMAAGFASRAAARRRASMPGWNMKNSSKMSRTWGGVRKWFSCSSGLPG